MKNINKKNLASKTIIDFKRHLALYYETYNENLFTYVFISQEFYFILDHKYILKIITRIRIWFFWNLFSFEISLNKIKRNSLLDLKVKQKEN